jgi:hypothetical protein
MLTVAQTQHGENARGCTRDVGPTCLLPLWPHVIQKGTCQVGNAVVDGRESRRQGRRRYDEDCGGYWVGE